MKETLSAATEEVNGQFHIYTLKKSHFSGILTIQCVLRVTIPI